METRDESTEGSVEPQAPLPEEEDLNALGDMARTLGRIQSRVLWGCVLAYLAAAGIGIAVSLSNPVRDWILWVGMYLVVFVYLTTYIKAHQRRRAVLKAVAFGITETMLVFWIWVLVDRIPARRVFVDEALTERAPLTLLWISVALLALIGVTLLVHWVWLGRTRSPRRAAT